MREDAQVKQTKKGGMIYDLEVDIEMVEDQRS